MDINGSIKTVIWSLLSHNETLINEGVMPDAWKEIDCFMAVSPIRHLHRIVALSNRQLEAAFCKKTSCSEVLRFFEILILMTPCKFSNLRELWASSQQNEYMSLPLFGRFMAYNRFEALRRHMRFRV